ncbi:SDR family NAD(P)-dependent oxidoreductase [Variovorax sp. Sphag1AA]|uniref:SDR family NAD(P)-dependent oxidoreductase n=1 Tax=Variovorax sp. Sphag1AA TaxID=2587027 RepID=UPI00160CB15B|nr:glucose 1-dehydrogenase [Variovorax sp. Sphag1AA]MBB3181340.1 NAD(P)-dependent dehydrogenase (short-subunit alcohol dehydrogenase family) [Variovorax sp. Sphag1AA]
MTERRLEGQVALVTGGGSGIGEAVARRLAADGAAVVVADIATESANAVARSLGDRALAVCADSGSEPDMQRAVALAVERFGALHIGVNAAGFGISAEVLDMDVERWNDVMRVTLGGVFVSCKAEARQMVRQGGGGVVINIASTNALQPAEGLSAYCTAKAGVAMFTRVAALELAQHRVRVVGVGPGLTATPATQRFLESPVASAAYLANIPAGRPAKAEEIASMVAYLASSEAGYITGDTFYVDGGLLTRNYPTLAERRPSGYEGADFLKTVEGEIPSR